MRIKSGNIPKELTYIVASPKTVTITCEDALVPSEEEEAAEEYVVKQEKVYPTFVSDSTNEKTLATGRQWAKSAGRYYDYQQKKWIDPTEPVTEVTRANDPISNLRVYGMDFRGNGGMAWKCADESGRYFDLREDILLDLMRTVGVSPGGYLNGKYIWAKIGSEMKLVRVGSDLHKALIVVTDRQEKKNIHTKHLVPWHFYQEKNGNVWLYAGKASGLRAVLDEEDTDFTRWKHWNSCKNQSHSSWYVTSYINRWKMDLSVEPPRPKRLEIQLEKYCDHLWIRVSNWDDSKSAERNIKNFDLKKEIEANKYYSSFERIVKFGTGLKIVSDLGEISGLNLFETFRENAMLKGFAINKQASENAVQSLLEKERNRALEMARYVEYGTMVPEGADLDPSHDYWLTEIISREPK